jgi:hypothetical protein
MHYQSVIAYFLIVFFGMAVSMAHANKEREQFADLLQKRKHLHGYWVGKRFAMASEEDSLDSGKQKKINELVEFHFSLSLSL